MTDPSLQPDPDAAGGALLQALVVDDDPLFRTLLVSLLKRDYQVTAAVDGSDGFYKALEHPPAVAVIDIQMPVWDGVKTIAAFRENAALRRVPLLVLTSDASKETVLTAIAAGADDFVIKCSLSREELLEKLRGLRDRRQRDSGAQADRVGCAGRQVATHFHSTASNAERQLQAAIDSWE